VGILVYCAEVHCANFLPRCFLGAIAILGAVTLRTVRILESNLCFGGMLHQLGNQFVSFHGLFIVPALAARIVAATVLAISG
jgi:hypothetical protein